MSRTYALACVDCKKRLWLGQVSGGKDRGHIYTGKPETMTALNEFLWDHAGHNLTFCDDSNLEGYDEIET